MSNQQHLSSLAPSLVGEWIVVASEQEFVQQQQIKTRLDGHNLTIQQDIIHAEKVYQIRFDALDIAPSDIAVQAAYGFVWLCIGTEKKPLFQLQEYDVAAARRVPCGA